MSLQWTQNCLTCMDCLPACTIPEKRTSEYFPNVTGKVASFLEENIATTKAEPCHNSLAQKILNDFFLTREHCCNTLGKWNNFRQLKWSLGHTREARLYIIKLLFNINRTVISDTTNLYDKKHIQYYIVLTILYQWVHFWKSLSILL